MKYLCFQKISNKVIFDYLKNQKLINRSRNKNYFYPVVRRSEYKGIFFWPRYKRKKDTIWKGGKNFRRCSKTYLDFHFVEITNNINYLSFEFLTSLLGLKWSRQFFWRSALEQILFGRKSSECLLSKRRTFIFLASSFKSKKLFRKSGKVKKELKLK